MHVHNLSKLCLDTANCCLSCLVCTAVAPICHFMQLVTKSFSFSDSFDYCVYTYCFMDWCEVTDWKCLTRLNGNFNSNMVMHKHILSISWCIGGSLTRWQLIVCEIVAPAKFTKWFACVIKWHCILWLHTSCYCNFLQCFFFFFLLFTLAADKILPSRSALVCKLIFQIWLLPRNYV